MFRAVLWKEWREQAAVLVALLVLGGAAAAAAERFSEAGSGHPDNFFGAVGVLAGIAFVMLAIAAGTTIGGTLFAGETEAGTDEFLAALPPTRSRVWRAKAAAGAVLAVAVGAALVGEVCVLGRVDRVAVATVVAFALGALVFGAFGWAMVGSFRMKTALAACGVGVLCALAAVLPAIVFGVVVKAICVTWFEGPEGVWNEVAIVLSVAAWAVSPLLLSWLLYTAPDWSRDVPEPFEDTIRALRKPVWTLPRGRAGYGAWALLWLLFRQWAVFAGVLGAVWLGLGLVMLADPVPMLTAWPAVTLLAGALVGAVGWADEQGRGSFRFWGERRLPATRLWLAKASAGLALTLGLGVLFLLPAFIKGAAGDHSDKLVAAPFPLMVVPRLGSGWSGALFYTFLWPVYGFAAGHLCGLLFRKAVVAFAVAVLAGGAVAGLWFPSVYGGGLHFWQFAATPLAAVVTARLLMRAWAADRLFAPRPVAALVAGLLVAFGATAVGLAWRVVEVPVLPGSDDDLAFVKTLPKAEENQAGQDIRAGMAKFEQTYRELMHREAATWLLPDEPGATPLSTGARASFNEQIHLVATRGYPTDRPDLDAWMDEVFADGWDGPLLAAAGKPLGVVENVADADIYTLLPAVQWLRQAGSLMIARGLQKQVQGDPAAYPRYLDATLAAARNVRNKSGSMCMLCGIAVESMALSSVSPWLERVGDQPDLLRQVHDILAKHEATNPTDLRMTQLADRTLARNMVANPARWAGQYLQYEVRARADQSFGNRMETEVDAIGFAWQVPWERERLNRVVGLGNDPDRREEVRALTRGGPHIFDYPIFFGDPSRFENQVKDQEAARRAATLMVALRVFRAEAGKPASGLGELVPKYLAAVPADPFDGKPFRYRPSAGEWVEMEAIPFQYVPEVRGPGVGAFAPADGGMPVAEVPQPVEIVLGTVAAVAGGVVQWPLDPLAADQGEAVPGLPVREPLGRRRQRVEAGQGVLWSVGLDGQDDGGVSLEERRGPNFSSGGDLIWVVPLPKP